jgi:rSAM/selenodomain-associated transferase 1
MRDERRVTIGVMARAPHPGACKTRLAASIGPGGAAALYRAMLLDTLDAIERTCDARLVVMAAPEDDGVAALRAIAPVSWEIDAQEGAGLGARLAHAFATLGADGRAVALVDSDSPTAPWDVAGRSLARFVGPRRALMGPCDDGGYWLIALTTPDIRILDGIAWSTPLVQEQTRARCAALGLTLEELPSAYDIDHPRDLDRLSAELRARPGRAPRTAAALTIQDADAFGAAKPAEAT